MSVEALGGVQERSEVMSEFQSEEPHYFRTLLHAAERFPLILLSFPTLVMAVPGAQVARP
jgi:hypothetical protein